MQESKLKNETKKHKRPRIDPDHFTVFKLREGWEKRVSKYWSTDEIDFFKERQELPKSIPEQIRIRTERDESYREGWVDAATWIHKEVKKIFNNREDV